MEPRFGHDFSRVHIHADTQAAESARAVSAKEYTVGSHVVFGRDRYAPQSIEGQRLIAHELTHVVQQAGSAAGSVLQRDPDPNLPQLPDVQLTLPHIGDSVGWRRRLMPQPMLNLNILLGSPQQLDLNLLDQELTRGGPLTRTAGEIGYGTMFCGGRAGSRSCPSASAQQDSSLPIEAAVFPRTPAAQPATPSTTTPGSSSGGNPSSPGATQPAATPAPRALVVGGIHGDEGGAPQHVLIAERLRTELNAGLARDFDTILIPVMNPGGLADNKRTNRHGVDLNRNFPGLPNFPAGRSVVEQPETEAVKRVIQILRPSRILVLHAQGDPNKCGVYADPVEGEAR